MVMEVRVGPAAVTPEMVRGVGLPRLEEDVPVVTPAHPLPSKARVAMSKKMAPK